MPFVDHPAVRPVRAAWKALPLPYAWRRRATRTLYGWLPHAEPAPPPRILYRPDVRTLEPGDLMLSGFLSAPTGIGRSGRMMARAFREGGVEPRLHDLSHDLGGHSLRDVPAGGVWLGVCNPPEALHFMRVAAHPVFERRYRIGMWAWELQTLPPDWVEALPLFHEVWGGSPFVADAIAAAVQAKGLDVRVRYTPYPLPDMGDARPDRARFGWKPGELAMLCMFDVNSTAARKNPLGAVEAFQRAFGPENAGVRLVVKANARGGDPKLVPEFLHARVAGWPNITLLVAELSDAEADGLLASADVFVSLHRSEGFGLSIAQTMVLGGAVAATGWSGNAEFQRGGVAEVPYALVPARDPSGRYEVEGEVWAEPDLDAAAAILRGFADDPAGARALGARGRELIAQRLPRAYDPATLAPWLASPPPEAGANTG